jgi:hypothetical protein
VPELCPCGARDPSLVTLEDPQRFADRLLTFLRREKELAAQNSFDALPLVELRTGQVNVAEATAASYTSTGSLDLRSS